MKYYYSLTRCGVILLLAITFAACGQKESNSKPNIIVILGDDLGYGDIGCYGQKLIKTPNVDRLAAEGLRFTQGYSGSTVCAPSRCVLMTGKHTGKTFIRNNGMTKTGVRVELPADEVTVAEILSNQGYATGLFGKWGLGEHTEEGLPNNQGFDEFYGYLNQGHAHRYYVDYLWHNKEKVSLPENANGKKGTHAAEWYFDGLKKFVRSNRDKPFFVYYAPQLPHSELATTDGDLRQYLDSEGHSVFKEHSHKAVRDLASTDIPNATYAGMVSQLDRHVGEIVDLLDELGLGDNTVIIFTSDNGPAAAKAGYNPDVFYDDNRFRGIKRDLYEGGVRVPLIVKWPGKVKAGTVSDYVFASWDFLPTITDILGIESPDNIDGVSALPVLQGKDITRSNPLYWEFISPVGSFRLAVRDGKWKGVAHGLEKELQLFDLDADPLEKHNLAGQYPDKVRELKKIIVEQRVNSEHWPADSAQIARFLAGFDDNE